MAVQASTVAAYKIAVTETDKVVKANKVIEPRFRDITGKLVSAMKDKDQPKIELYMKALEVERTAITTAMKSVDMALGNLRQVETEDDFVATRLADIEKLMNIVDAAKKSLTAKFRAIEKLDAEAHKAADAARDVGEEAAQTLARIDRDVDEEKKRLSALYRKAEDLNTKASDAVDERDAKALKDAQSVFDALDVETQLLMHEELIKLIKSFAEQSKAPVYGPDARAEMLAGVKDLLAREAGVNVYVEQLGKLKDRIPALAIKPIDIAKAAKVLSIERKGEATLAKVLNGPVAKWEQGLDTLAKQLGLKTKGKDMLQALKKAGVV